MFLQSRRLHHPARSARWHLFHHQQRAGEFLSFSIYLKKKYIWQFFFIFYFSTFARWRINPNNLSSWRRMFLSMVRGDYLLDNNNNQKRVFFFERGMSDLRQQLVFFCYQMVFFFFFFRGDCRWPHLFFCLCLRVSLRA